MDTDRKTDDEQVALWNGVAGRAWVEAQEVLDQVLKPFEELLVEAVIADSASRVLDVGCGTGGTTLAAARSLGANGRCTGIDISEPMIVAARARAERERLPATFIQDDAQIIDQTEEQTRNQVIQTVRAAFDPYVQGSEVRYVAACWTVGARALNV